MAWSWSHTHEAYVNAENNLKALEREKLVVIFAEWRASQNRKGEYTDDFDKRRYERALRWASDPNNISDEALAEFIWERASELATCDNGGFNAWMCPFGCGCHTVSFSTPEELAAAAADEE